MKQYVGVIGGGLMGCGIATVAACAGNKVIVVEKAEAVRNTGKTRVEALAGELLANGLVTAEQAEFAATAVSFTDDLALACQECYFIIEAIIENLPAKQAIFETMDRLADDDVIIVSNTSGLRITDIGERVQNKKRIATAHFWFPAHIVPLVEVVMGDNGTSEETAQKISGWLKGWGKAPVIVRRDLPGQLANRILQAVIREATSIVESGLASAEDVDTAVKMGMGIRMPVWGPLEHADAVGLDLVCSVQNSVLPSISGADHACGQLEEFAAAKQLGYKTGKGYYDWNVKSMPDLEKLRNDFIMSAVKMIRARQKQD